MKFIDICTALYDYQSRSNEELSFKADDTLLIIDKDDPDWYKAQLITKDFDGPIGLVPSNYIEKNKSIGTVKALYDYQAQSPEELSFKIDDVMTLYYKDDPDWYFAATKDDQFGLIPRNYTEELTSPKETGTSIDTPACEPKWAIALYKFDPQDKEETQLDENEQILVTDYVSSSDWWTIEHKDGKSGIVPATYVKFQDEYEAELKKQEMNARKEQEQLQQSARMKAEEEERERSRQEEAERRRKMQEEARQKEEEKRRQEALMAARSTPTYSESASPRRSQIPAPPPPISATQVSKQAVVPFDPNKPDPTKIRWWTDRTGAFKVEAQLVACSNGKIRLFKTNGVKIDVPLEKMCIDDLKYVEQETGQKLVEDKTDNIPLAHLSRKFSWLEYFKKMNMPHDASNQYARAFEREHLGENDIERLTYGKMRSLGMSEKHIRLLQKFIETNQAEPLSDDESTRPKIKVKKSVTFGSVSIIEDHAVIEVSDDEDEYNDHNEYVQKQIEQDERLARMLQEQENQQQINAHISTPSVTLQRRGTGRPTPSHSAPKDVNPDAFTSNQFKPETLKPTPAPPPMRPLQPSPVQHTASLPLGQPSQTPSNTVTAVNKSGFEDDAWTPRSSHSSSIQTYAFTGTNVSNSPSINSAAPQLPARPRPTPQISQQSSVDPQLLAKWGGSPSLAAANQQPVPPIPSAPNNNSTVGFNQANSFGHQNSLQPFQQQQQQQARLSPIMTANNSFTGTSPSMQHQQPTQFASQFSTLPQHSSTHTMHVTPLQPALQPPLVPQPTTSPVPSYNMNPMQPQMTASSTMTSSTASSRTWANATPDNPFGTKPANHNAPLIHSHSAPILVNNNFQQQSFNTPGYSSNVIDPTDKYSIFKTIDTNAPSILKPAGPFQQQQQPQSQHQPSFVQMQTQQYNSMFMNPQQQQQRW
ncbi:unnamed protein product [Rhizopus microsporus]|uniref:Actin cytoskeleton-regulatory complex protein SLA1 n=1 Tax=Rhizopus microsporus TaxID=58291 RepID=A0A1X0SAC2_RHIZD|nr:hypothetical protein BCV71DRAFT_261368 [Rhizopus microsporus]